jgi:hypothetical protein
LLPRQSKQLEPFIFSRRRTIKKILQTLVLALLTVASSQTHAQLNGVIEPDMIVAKKAAEMAFDDSLNAYVILQRRKRRPQDTSCRIATTIMISVALTHEDDFNGDP